jgi:hypothetical protein
MEITGSMKHKQFLYPVYRRLAWAPQRGTFHQALFYFAFWMIQSFKSGVSSRFVTAWAVVQIAEM